MTMQIGMVGTDGILLASDTLSQEAGIVRSTFNSHKIKISHERGIAISAALDMETARHVADAIICDLKDEDMGSPTGPIQTIASGICQSARDRDRHHVECLIVLASPSPRLFCLQHGVGLGEFGVCCEEILGKCIAGDRENAAVFWSERYYQRLPGLPIKKLIPLAAHLIVAAHKLNNGGVDGLEIVVCDTSGLRRLSEDCIRELESKANEWDQRIADLILNG